VAREAADQLADEVVAMATAAITRLDVAARPVDVVLGGGVFDTRDHGFTTRVETGVLAVAPKATLRRLGVPPIVGAALLGLDAIGADAAASETARAALSSPG
jgi:hypothetical protein